MVNRRPCADTRYRVGFLPHRQGSRLVVTMESVAENAVIRLPSGPSHLSR